jgi:hypothetical protein
VLHLGDGGKGVNRKLPHLGDGGKGVNRQLPHLGDGGTGVNRQLPHLGNGGTGGLCAEKRAWVQYWFAELQDAFREARIACGDWERICSPGTMTRNGPCAVLLDPPYSQTGAVYAPTPSSASPFVATPGSMRNFFRTAGPSRPGARAAATRARMIASAFSSPRPA